MSSLFKTSGTYYVLLAVLPLPLSLLESLLPKHVYDNLLPVPDQYDCKEGEHIVFLELGRQHKTGTPLYRFSAQEAKFEIPFVRHPSSSPTAIPASRALPCVYKHTIWSDTSMITFGARYSMGLRTEKAVFDPAEGPMEGEDGKYVVKGRLEWKGEEVGEADEEGMEGVLKLTKDWWFGDFTGNKLNSFTFSNPIEPPTLYKSTVRLYLPSLRLGAAELPRTLNTTRTNMSLDGEWLTVSGVKTWVVVASWDMNEPKAVGDLEN